MIKKQVKNKFLIFISSMLFFLITMTCFLDGNVLYVEAATIEQSVSLTPTKQKNDKNIWSVRYTKDGSFYNLDYQNAVEKRIAEQKRKKSYTIYNPLLVLNPYGTNTCGINMYFDSKEEVYAVYTVVVKDAGIKNFTQTLYNGGKNNLTKNHSYQLTGLIPNITNTVYVSVYNKAGEKKATLKFRITMPKLKSAIETKMKTVEKGESKQAMSNGLYAMMGHDKAFQSNIYFYDNTGVLRGEIPLLGYRTDRIQSIGNDILFCYSDHDIARMNRLGKLVAKYKFEGYTMHHDFIYDKATNKLFILVSENDTGVVEDVIITVDIKDGKVKKLLDFKDYMPETYEKALANHKKRLAVNKDVGDLDWIHFNSIQCVDGKDLILSARELSTIVRINDVLKKPYLKTLIADESVWEGTKYEKLVYKKTGDFVSQAGQHTVNYGKGSLKEGQYYLSMFNNNYAGAASRPDYDWSNYPNAGNFEVGENSYYYKYLVDEKAKTYRLVEEFPVPYSSIVSSAQSMGDTFVISSGKDNSYGEYNKQGELIRKFSYDAEKYSYRVLKYTFKNFWFY